MGHALGIAEYLLSSDECSFHTTLQLLVLISCCGGVLVSAAAFTRVRQCLGVPHLQKASKIYTSPVLRQKCINRSARQPVLLSHVAETLRNTHY